MKYKIHIDAVAALCEQLAPLRKLAFAAWCAERLVGDAASFLGSFKEGRTILTTLRAALDDIWSLVRGGQSQPETMLNHKSRVDSLKASFIKGDFAAVADNYRAVHARSAVQAALNVAITGSADGCVGAADAAIFVHERFLWDVEAPVNGEYPSMKDEYERQSRFLEDLRDGRVIGLDGTTFPIASPPPVP